MLEGVFTPCSSIIFHLQTLLLALRSKDSLIASQKFRLKQAMSGIF